MNHLFHGTVEQNTQIPDQQPATMDTMKSTVIEPQKSKKASERQHARNLVNSCSPVFKSERRYRTLFEKSPIAFIEVDPSDLKRYFADLRKRGIKDYRTYFISNPEVVYTCINKCKLIDVNAAAVRLYQAGSRENYIKNYQRGFVKEAIEGVRDAYVAFAEGKKVVEQELVQQDFQGKRKILCFKGAMIPSSEGPHWQMLITLIDITPLRQAEAELLKHKVIFENTQVGNTICTLEGILTNINPAYGQMMGYSPDELVGQHYSLVIHDSEKYGKKAGHFVQLLREGKLTNLEVLHQKKDGTIIPTLVNAAVIRNDRGEPAYIAVSTIDITEQKQLEKDLKNFKTISDRSNIGNAIYDLNGFVHYMNEAMAAMHGYRVEEASGKHYSFFHTEDQMPDVEAKYRHLDRAGHIRNVEIKDKRKDGTTFPILVNATRIEDGQGNPRFTALSALDISYRKKIEHSLREHEQALEVRNLRLQEMNTALKVLMNRSEDDHLEMEEQVVANVQDSALPLLEGLKKTNLNDQQKMFVDALQSALHTIISPFLRNISYHNDFSSTELMIVNLIKQGKQTSEIAEMLHLAHRTIDTYRGRIRKKLGICNAKANLRSQLIRFESDRRTREKSDSRK
nr:PAS domain S-box protein [Deltaproteobacteria bacterium]